MFLTIEVAHLEMCNAHRDITVLLAEGNGESNFHVFHLETEYNVISSPLKLD